MKNTISTKALSKHLSDDIVTAHSGFTSITIDTEAINLSASLNLYSNVFECDLYLGSNEFKTVLSIEQQDLIYNLLLNTEARDVSGYGYGDKEPTLTFNILSYAN